VIVQCRARVPAAALTVLREVNRVLDERGAVAQPSVTMAVSDSVALGIAGMFTGPTPSGQVLERFFRTGTADSDQLLAAARFEQGYASAEGHATLHCLMGWVRKRMHLEAAAGRES